MPRSTFAAILFALVVTSSCGSDSGTTATGGGGGSHGPAARVDITVLPASSSPAGTTTGPFTVKVVDASNVAVPGVVVTFTTVGALTLSQQVVTTDANGLASTQVTSGSVVGGASVRAAANGVTNAVTATVTIVAGPAAKIVVAPKTARLASVGDTVRVSASAQDQFGNATATSTVAYGVTDPLLLSVDAGGLVRVLRLGGTAFVIASSNGKADTSVVTVLAAGSSLCTGFAAVTPLNVGESVMLASTQYGCFSGSTAGAEYTLVAYNSSTDPASPINASITGSGLNVPPVTSLIGQAPPVQEESRPSSDRTLDESFHLRLMRGADERFKRMASPARAQIAQNVASGAFSAAAAGAIPTTAKVGDIVTVNVSANYCDTPVNRGLRVTAIGTRSIVLADTLNPANGFATADYQRFATNFDTLVYPLDIANFGAPVDIDANGRVALVFTRSVNELVNSNTGSFVGGFFNPRDIFPKKATVTADDCPASNEGEMVFLVVPAPAGINGVTHTVGQIDSLVNNLMAHELQHLINAERRFYVNAAPVAFQDVWLNEGLSHIAEELLYYRESGFNPRQNLDDATIRINNPQKLPFFAMDAVANFARLGVYLSNPGANSPFANNDQLATRGATWSFLRYAADRLGTTDGTIWQRMVNSNATGLSTLQAVFGTDPGPLFRDWTVANFMDDFAGGTDARYQHKSWNYRDVFTASLITYTKYPLLVGSLVNTVKSDLSVRGGSAGYLRFAVPGTKEALMTFSSGGGLPASSLQFVVVRTK